MPTLANIQGSSLVPDLSGPLRKLDELAERRRKAQAEEESLEALRVAGGLPTPPAAPDDGGDGIGGVLRSIFSRPKDASGRGVRTPVSGGDPDISDRLDNAVRAALGQRTPPPVKSESVSLLGQIDPAAAKLATEVAERGSEVESAEFRDAVTKGMTLAKEIQDLPDFASRRRRLAELASESIASGTPEGQQRIFQLMNLDEAHLGLELTRMQAAGPGMLATVPEIKPTGSFRLFKTPEQRDALAQLMISNPAAAGVMISNQRLNLARDEEARLAAEAAAGPQTELAQALARVDTDEARGDLTSETANARRRSLRLEATKAGRAEDQRAAASRIAAAKPKTAVGRTLANIDADEASGALTAEEAGAEREKVTGAPTKSEIFFDDAGNAVAQFDPNTGKFTALPKAMLPAGADTEAAGRFTKAPGVIVRLPDGTTAQAIPVLNERTGEVENVLVPIEGEPISRLGETAVEARTGEIEETRGKAQAKAEIARTQGFINDGFVAADQVPILSRSIELLASIETGGFEAAALRVKQLFGIEGADEGELSANLGKAVLSQLKGIFGAQFTEREGARLERIEAGFGKSTEANIRLLQQAKRIMTRAADRGISAAESVGDTPTADDIREALEFSLTPPSVGAGVGAIPPAALSSPALLDVANRNGVTPQDVWDNLSDEARAALIGEE